MTAGKRIARQFAAAAAVAATAVMLGGCGSSRINLDPTEWFSGSGGESRPASGSEGGFTVTRGEVVTDTPRAITASDLVGADGRCEGGSSETASPPRTVSLTMTECELVTVAGTPEQINIGTEGDERRTVLTYSKGDNPGIYTFVSGRLKIIERVPTPPRPTPRRRAPKRRA